MTLERTPGQRAPGARICVEQRQEAVGVAEAAHPAQHRRGRVLEGQVEVGRDARRCRRSPDQAGPRLGRLQVGDPHPLDAVDGRQLGQQRLEQPQVAEVLAVGRGVLADQEQLLDALLGQPAGLAEHVARAAGDERAAEARDRAERAAPVAAAGQLQRGHRAAVEPAAYGAGAGARGHAGRAGRARRWCGRDDDARLLGVAVGRGDRQQLAAVLRGVRLRACSPARIAAQPRRRCRGSRRSPSTASASGSDVGQLLAVALGQAADRDDGLRGAVGLEVGGLQQRVDGVLLGGLDEAAGVDHHRLGVGRVVDQPEPAGLEPAGQLLGVDLVAGAAQRHQRDRGQVGVGAGAGAGSAEIVIGVFEYAGRRPEPANSAGVTLTVRLCNAPDPGPTRVGVEATLSPDALTAVHSKCASQAPRRVQAERRVSAEGAAWPGWPTSPRTPRSLAVHPHLERAGVRGAGPVPAGRPRTGFSPSTDLAANDDLAVAVADDHAACRRPRRSSMTGIGLAPAPGPVGAVYPLSMPGRRR